ncbi:hypothetical protein E3G44_000397 [Mycobacteroides abscessus]|nr:hypothetical protein [Mycobacteroides abscessus]SHO94631.1 Uncharacterised protein [Mycobacteroides abscessus subsp. abscessus]SHP88671.1 Uncharacterised protein [Mycobacteroides abscessus subsp. abscessus]SHP91909.1 Uncharacterised protein [Mycobacteroides abscessus subsp. abscessus]SHQ16511.1 Uncharacterised protein [Mycobacteroides abscessus subsp. abscessus]
MLKSAGQEEICIRDAEGVRPLLLGVARENAAGKTFLVASISGWLR